jgi:hypothetical protein
MRLFSLCMLGDTSHASFGPPPAQSSSRRPQIGHACHRPLAYARQATSLLLPRAARVAESIQLLRLGVNTAASTTSYSPHHLAVPTARGSASCHWAVKAATAVAQAPQRSK